ncbi:MAG TPA: PAS-domain containing protein, partial [Pseudorhodoplanes sp.]|nr:PAS-domain containing protein [Pseudorhodoplanes sp.]
MSRLRAERSQKSKNRSRRRKRAQRASDPATNGHDSAAALALARRETKTAVANAEQADIRLREALDILPQGIVFLDPEGRYILWNQQYSDIYKRSADLFRPGAKLADTLRIGIARGDYPEAIGREDEWLAQRLSLLANPRGRHEQRLADGRWIMIEERRTSDGGVIGLRVDITEMKRREASFRLLFDGNPVPMFVCARDDRRILAVNDAAIAHYGYGRETLLTMNLRNIEDDADQTQVHDLESATAEEDAGKTWIHRKADGAAIDVAIFSRRLTHNDIPAVLIAAMDITERKRAEARVAYMAHHDALTALPNRVMLRLRMEEMLTRMQRNGGGVAALCIDLDGFKSVNDAA